VSVKLKNSTFADQDLNRFRSDVAEVVQQLDVADQPNVVVKTVTGNLSLTGTEDYVLVDMSGATRDVYLLLPQPGAMSRAITVKLTKPGKAGLYLKGSDDGRVTINGTAAVLVSDSATVVATPTQFYTV
jgi:hypothetical protein